MDLSVFYQWKPNKPVGEKEKAASLETRSELSPAECDMMPNNDNTVLVTHVTHTC